ncbi:hypothetical protein [Puniceibacterium sp. IMCC21224]|uniref:hypothetical protein n=1 Tax=Puniceibacterium sp. IMCC21224 TaxID=1618204 RepID=UPI00065D7679|nr:hypothetical protein [Puniceibacterium sp. IMCC21224]KMK64011.1 hypothetical protein IMCC21224_1669 [Puniceibacterium sp. IMCC21224]
MRMIAVVFSLLALAATALAGQELWQVWQHPLPSVSGLRAAASSATPAGAEPQPPSPPRRWPALFGELRPPEPQPPKPPEPQAEPQPPAPRAPPLASLGFSLRGMVSDGASRWVIVAHPTGDQLFKVGDALTPDYTIARIDEEGLWAVTAPGAEPQLLGFAE